MGILTISSRFEEKDEEREEEMVARQNTGYALLLLGPCIDASSKNRRGISFSERRDGCSALA